MDRSRFRYSSPNRRDWVDWLTDAPPSPAAKQTLRQSRVQSAPAYKQRFVQNSAPAQPVSPSHPDLTININLQKIKLPKLRLPNIARIKNLPFKRMAIAFVILAVLTGAYFNFVAGNAGPKGQTASAKVARTQPSFNPVAPVTKPELGDFAAHVTAYDGRRDIYSYADSINGSRITISEQPAPSNLGSGEQALAKIAAQAGASQQITTKSGSAYLKTDQETGAQVAVCSINGLLLFINSSTKFQESDWIKYINDLQ